MHWMYQSFKMVCNIWCHLGLKIFYCYILIFCFLTQYSCSLQHCLSQDKWNWRGSNIFIHRTTDFSVLVVCWYTCMTVFVQLLYLSVGIQIHVCGSFTFSIAWRRNIWIVWQTSTYIQIIHVLSGKKKKSKETFT